MTARPLAALALLVVHLTPGADVRAQDSDEWWTGLDSGPGVHVAEVDSLYRISGFTHDDIYREMQRKGPGTDEIGVRLGVHHSDWRWSFRYRQQPGCDCGREGACRLAGGDQCQCTPRSSDFASCPSTTT